MTSRNSVNEDGMITPMSDDAFHAARSRIRSVCSFRFIFQGGLGRRLPRFFDQFNRHLGEVLVAKGMTEAQFIDAVKSWPEDAHHVSEAPVIYEIIDALAERAGLSNPAPADTAKSPQLVPGHTTFPGSFESNPSRRRN